MFYTWLKWQLESCEIYCTGLDGLAETLKQLSTIIPSNVVMNHQQSVMPLEIIQYVCMSQTGFHCDSPRHPWKRKSYFGKVM